MFFFESITTLFVSGNLADNSQMPRNEQRHIVIAKYCNPNNIEEYKYLHKMTTLVSQCLKTYINLPILTLASGKKNSASMFFTFK